VEDPANDPGWRALKSEIEQVVQLESASIELGGRALRWYRVANPEQLLEVAVESRLPAVEVDPFWAATWRAAQGLDRYLSRLNCLGMRVLELGCGSGQAGIGAAARGAQVVLTDAVPLALQVAQLNAWPVAANCRWELLRWGIDCLDEPAFPLILGSDLVYDPSHFPQLESCARQHLDPHGRLLLSEPHRHTGDKFARWIVEAGWSMREHDVDMNDGRVPIRIFECWLKL
jgi:predicted nicotinamide N-methyase